MQRRLTLDSIENIRDLGGYSTSNGKQTRWRSFLRADHYRSWTPATCQALIDYGVKLVIDLRAPHETISLPNSFADSEQVTYLNLPFMPNEVQSGIPFQTLLNRLEDPHEMYAFMLDECKTPIGEIFTAIATHNTPTTLFHCHAGKDRTGVIAALLLSLAGVDDDAISQDYALTGDYLSERLTNERVQAVAMGEDMRRHDALSITPLQSMRTTLGYLRDRHTDTPAYLQACGVSNDHINVLRALMTEGA